MRSPADLGIPLQRTRRDQRHYSCSGGLFVTVNRSLGVGCNAVSAPRASTRRLAASRIRIYAVRALLPTHLSQPYRLVVWTVCRTWRHSHIDVTQDRRNVFALLQAAIGAAVQAGEHRFDRQELRSESVRSDRYERRHTNVQIGWVLGRPTRTVATHVEHILAKRDVRIGPPRPPR